MLQGQRGASSQHIHSKTHACVEKNTSIVSPYVSSALAGDTQAVPQVSCCGQSRKLESTSLAFQAAPPVPALEAPQTRAAHSSQALSQFRLGQMGPVGEQLRQHQLVVQVPSSCTQPLKESLPVESFPLTLQTASMSDTPGCCRYCAVRPVHAATIGKRSSACVAVRSVQGQVSASHSVL